MPTIGMNFAIEAAARLGTLIDAHGRDAGRQLGEWLRPWLRDDETLPDFSLVLELPARMIRHAGQSLRDDRRELEEARRLEGEARFQRDQAATALRRKLVESRRLLTSVLGPRHAAKLLGLAGKTARAAQPALLLSQTTAFLCLLGDPRRLALTRADHYLDPVATAAALEPLAAACRQACDHLDEICQVSAARLAARDRASAELWRAVQGVVRLLGGWLQLVGRSDLAEKLRRITSRGR